MNEELKLTKKQLKMIEELSPDMFQSGSFGDYYTLSPKIGLKIIASRFKSELEAVNSAEFCDLWTEFKNLKRAEGLGISPKAYQIGAIQIGTLWAVGIKMEHCGERISKRYKGAALTKIVSKLHNEFNEKLSHVGMSYVDMHSNNVCIKNGRFYLIDFGPQSIDLYVTYQNEAA